MKTHSSYTEFFRDVAVRHKLILHDVDPKKKSSFMRLVLGETPFPSLDIVEFVQKTRSMIKPPFMLLQSRTNQYGQASDQWHKRPMGAFLILDRPTKENDYDARDACITKCEGITEDIIGWMDNWFRVNYGLYTLNHNSIASEVVGPIDGYWGVRVDFVYDVLGNGELTYDANKFN